jgi:2-dehydro-3-deoxyphosphogluconate aldolase / (4S)-4-hydroxy-2-oxoglutarate aldolase
MTREHVLHHIHQVGLMPVLRASSAQSAITAAAAIEAAGVTVLEVTMTVPGALTPTEIVTAWEAGADAVKVFPCSAVGGAKYLTALKGPLPQIEMIPTGGVSLSNAADFLAAGAFALGVGGDLISMLAKDNPEIITENARKYVAIVSQTRARASDGASGSH